ncbi:MAG: hypothetical protein R6V32_08465, partial [Bacteroidales bacterium]
MKKLKKLFIIIMLLGFSVQAFSQASIVKECDGDYLKVCLSCGHAPVTWTFDDPSQVNVISTGTLCITLDVYGYTGFTVEYDAWGCGSYGAGSMTTTTGSVSPTDMEATVNAGSDSPVCEGNTINLTESGGDATSWSWSGPGSFSSSANNPSITGATTAESGTYYVTVTDGSGCTNTDNVGVTVNTESTAPNSASASPNPICQGESTTLGVSGGSLGTGASWYWYSGSCGGTSIGTGSPTVSPTSTTTYYVRAEGTCNTTSCASVTVNVDSESDAPTGASASPNPICSGESTTLSQSGGSLGTNADWYWYSGSCGGTSIGTGSPTVSPTSNTTYYVRAEGDCNTTTCESVTVSVGSESDAPTGITGTTTICEGDDTDLSVDGGNLGTGATWEWYSGHASTHDPAAQRKPAVLDDLFRKDCVIAVIRAIRGARRIRHEATGSKWEEKCRYEPGLDQTLLAVGRALGIDDERLQSI